MLTPIATYSFLVKAAAHGTQMWGIDVAARGDENVTLAERHAR